MVCGYVQGCWPLLVVVGFLMSGRFEQEFGRTLFTSGAIIISGILISSAILEKNRKG
jgi:hypothetical protein